MNKYIWRRIPPKTKLSSRGQDPCSTGPLLGECSRNPSVSVYHLALLWEAAFGFTELFFFWRRNAFSYFMMGDLWAHLPTPHWVFGSFWRKMAGPPCPTLPIHPISPLVTFFVFLDEKSSQREMFCWYGIGETKNCWRQKRHQNQREQRLFWAVGKMSQ